MKETDWQGNNGLHICCKDKSSDTAIAIIRLLLQHQLDLIDMLNKKKKKPLEMIGRSDPRSKLFQEFGFSTDMVMFFFF